MTLSVAILNDDFALVATDRRLSAGRYVGTDEQDKTFALLTDDARMSVSFTGLATANGFSTHDFLVKNAGEWAKPDYRIGGLVDRMCSGLTEKFKKDPVLRGISPEAKRLSILFVGYIYTPDPVGSLFLISNFHDPGKLPLSAARENFNCWSHPAVDRPGVMFIGTTSGLDMPGLDQACTDAQSIGPKAAAARLVNIIRKASDKAATKNTIGKQITSLVVPAGLQEPFEGEYHTAKPVRRIFIPAYVWATSKFSGAMFGGDVHAGSSPFHVDTSSPAVAVPVVPKNRQCPCGSGKKYKMCHGRKPRAQRRRCG